MTDPTTPTPPPSPTGLPGDSTISSSAVPVKRPTTRAWTIGAIALIVALCGGGIGLAALTGDEKPVAGVSSTAASSPTRAAPAAAAPTPATPAIATYDTPTTDDFKLKVKILRKKCFGSAGCNITYRIDVTYTGMGLDPTKTYEVTYDVKGAEDPIVNTLEVTGDTASVQQEEMASTRRSTDKLTAVVTSVSEL